MHHAIPHAITHDLTPMQHTTRYTAQHTMQHADVAWHPHHGMDILSYMVEGCGRHADSLGNRETFGSPGTDMHIDAREREAHSACVQMSVLGQFRRRYNCGPAKLRPR